MRIDLRVQTPSQAVQAMQLMEDVELHNVHSRVIRVLNSMAFEVSCFRFGNSRDAPFMKEQNSNRQEGRW